MPRHPDPELEERILKAAHALWKRGGDQALTMRAVARAAHTNTPALYRRFKDRQDLIRGLLLRIAGQLREHFTAGKTLEGMAEAYVEYAIKLPHEYELFYMHSGKLSPPKGAGRPRPIRESRPNFALVEELLAGQFGGRADDYTNLALALWAILHGTSMLLVSKSIPEGHEEELRRACRSAVEVLMERAKKFSESALSGK